MTEPVIVPSQRQIAWGWPAVLNLTLGGAGAAVFLFGAVWKLFDQQTMVEAQRLPFELLALVLVCIGFAAVSLEAGRPMRALRLLSNLPASWMSVESIAGGVFIVFTSCAWFFGWTLCYIAAAAAALLFMVSQGRMVHGAVAVKLWNERFVPLFFVISNLVAAIGLILVNTDTNAITLSSPIIWTFLACLVANLILWVNLVWRPGSEHDQRGAAVLKKPLVIGCVIGAGHFIPLLYLAIVAGTAVTQDQHPFLALANLFTGMLLVLGSAGQKFGLIIAAGYYRPMVLKADGDALADSPASLNRSFHLYNTKAHHRYYNALAYRWTGFWMRFAGLSRTGRIASWLAVLFAPPHKARVFMAKMNRQGFIDPSATIYHAQLQLGANVFIGDHVVIFENKAGGPVQLGSRVNIFRHTVIETAHGGSLIVEEDASIHPRCQINAYAAPIRIGKGTMIAPNCAFYPYDHGVAPDRPIREQPLQSKGGITIGSEAWLGFGVIVLGGVRIGNGAVVAAGSVVTKDIPDGAIAMGAPARVIRLRKDLG